MREYKILVTGEPLVYNKGCMGMVMGLMKGLKDRGLENVSIYIFSSKFYIADKELYERYKNIHVIQMPWTNIKDAINKRYSILSYVNELLLLLLLTIRYIPVSIKKFFNQFDLIVDINGDSLTEDYGLLPLIRRLLPLHIARVLNIDTFINAQTIGPFNSLLGRYIATKVLKEQSLITAREDATYNYLQGLGIKQNLKLTADLAFLQEPTEPTKTKEVEILLKDCSKNLLVGVSISALINKWSDNKNQNNDKTFVQCFAELCETICEKYNCRIVCLPHVIRPEQDDRKIAREVINKMRKHKDRIILLEGNYPSSELKWIIGRCDIVISSRMHAAIAALSQYIPAICIGKGIKFSSLIGERLHFREHVFDISKYSFSEITEKVMDDFDYFIKNREFVIRDLNENVERQKELAGENIKYLVNLLQCK